MTNVLAPPQQGKSATSEQWRFDQSIYGLLTGQADWGAPVSLTSHNDASVYALTVQNQHATGHHLNIPAVLTATNSGVDIGTLRVSGNLDVDGDVDVGGDLTVGDDVSIDGDLTVDGTTQANGTLNVLGPLNASGNVSIGNADADVHTIVGLTTFRNAANTTIQQFIDAANNRVIFGANTALAGAADDKVSVVGGALHVAANSGTTALGVRYSPAGTGVVIGAHAAANPDLIVAPGGTETFRVGNAASTYQAKVTGDLNVTDDAVIAGDVTADKLFAGDGLVGGPSHTFTSDIDSGFYWVSSGRIGVAGNGSKIAEFANTGSVLGLGIGNQPSVPFHVNTTQSGDWISIFEQTSSSSGRKGVQVKSANTTAADTAFQVELNGTPALRVFGDLAVTLGGAFTVGSVAMTPAASTWTPTVGGTCVLGAANEGYYIKIGRKVTAWGTLSVTTRGTGSQSVISGLPFQCDLTATGNVGIWNTAAASYVFMSVQAAAGTSTLSVLAATAATASLSSANAITDGTTIRFTITYRTAS